ncbi:uncharacterized protein [Procambarus clarkii]|uniref:uncharacterized protein isoform X1 n=1 Tax=Procambarus clarkii TaxID=6728 RepID=UPI001E675B1E|nr:protein argonaute 14-like isoform X1 [Procambarus clarkii]XP_045617698.1 protein argonaute 14-like isoform X1 [Procambarus clarkii]XP_045617699.1 protein argonaute 14-like isoform X1 [Procambarus clarkii]XP_045617700.1 protein argonaute 14-like isoform X1 [Procambarus clarkii]XP_045617701.1 protein argonaute 14-like isoform X1 [Procambarus clarkii]XP_045617702.1 protein argonaute 14-like isoform X1 [Procambarus clarkii]
MNKALEPSVTLGSGVPLEGSDLLAPGAPVAVMSEEDRLTVESHSLDVTVWLLILCIFTFFFIIIVAVICMQWMERRRELRRKKRNDLTRILTLSFKSRRPGGSPGRAGGRAGGRAPGGGGVGGRGGGVARSSERNAENEGEESDGEGRARGRSEGGSSEGGRPSFLHHGCYSNLALQVSCSSLAEKDGAPPPQGSVTHPRVDPPLSAPREEQASQPAAQAKH